MMHVAVQHELPKRSKELATLLRATIDAYQLREAKLTDAEVDLALASLRRVHDPNETKKAIAVVLGIIGLFTAVAIAVAAEKGRLTEATPLPAGVYLILGIGGAAVGLAVILYKRAN